MWGRRFQSAMALQSEYKEKMSAHHSFYIPKLYYMHEHKKWQFARSDSRGKCSWAPCLSGSIKGFIVYEQHEGPHKVLQFYCRQHLDDNIRTVFKNGLVTVVDGDGNAREVSAEEIIQEKKEIVV